MRITKIELEGRPGHTATLTRPEHGDHIEVTYATPAGGRTHLVVAGDAEDRWSMAQILQHALEGFRGAGGDIREYARALELLAD